jgi:hypothetical protein
VAGDPDRPCAPRELEARAGDGWRRNRLCGSGPHDETFFRALGRDDLARKYRRAHAARIAGPLVGIAATVVGLFTFAYGFTHLSDYHYGCVETGPDGLCARVGVTTTGEPAAIAGGVLVGLGGAAIWTTAFVDEQPFHRPRREAPVPGGDEDTGRAPFLLRPTVGPQGARLDLQVRF